MNKPVLGSYLTWYIDALNNGCHTCIVWTVDNEIVVILIGMIHHLPSKYLYIRIWVAFCTGKAFTYLHINSTCYYQGEKIFSLHLNSIRIPFQVVLFSCTASGYLARIKFAWENLEVLSWSDRNFHSHELYPYIQLNSGSQFF